MSNELPLIRKFRPSDFNEIIGNKSLVKMLEDKTSSGNVTTFLLHGPTGCGKTTFSRIISKALGANKSNIKEYNVSNQRGIDDARKIIDESRYTALGGGSKIYVLNECHQSTKGWQNAMLEILEEPPKNTYFILCTTEPNKLLPTIKGRCLDCRVKKLMQRECNQLIRRVLTEEAIDNFSKAAMQKIAKKSEGIPRNLLSILEKVIHIEDQDEMLEEINGWSAESSDILELCKALLSKNSWKTIANSVKNIPEEPETIRRGVLNYMNKVLLSVENPVAAIIIECFEKPFFDSGPAGLTLASYMVFQATKKK